MNRLRLKIKNQNPIFLYLCFYFIVNLIFLTDFPYVHSDEPWLSGLSRAMLLNRDFSVTEPFFDVYERNPHAIKILFHMFQILSSKLFGYQIFSFRIISLLFSLGSLYFFYGLCKLIFLSDKFALITTMVLSLDIQYIYASHLARQEIIILFVIIFSVYTLLRRLEEHTYATDLLIGITIGLSIGIHPNSFIAALALGSMYLYMLSQKKVNLKNLLLLIFTIFVFALLFIGISLYMDANFFQHYAQNGVKFGVHQTVLQKLARIRTFYENIYQMKSIHYYLPNIKFQLFVFALAFFVTPMMLFKNRKEQIKIKFIAITISAFFLNIGMILIGRYNETSILFIFPFMYILAVHALLRFSKKSKLPILLLLFLTVANTAVNAKPYASSYNEYITSISPYVQKDDKVLSNINTGYYFENESLLDYRNLRHIKNKDISFKDYIFDRKIKYIIYSNELDYISNNSPNYNTIYGDPSYYYSEMKSFIEMECTEVSSFTNPTYGTCIAPLVDKKPWKVTIFKVKELQ